MTAKRGPPVQVVTKYPQAIAQDQIKNVNTSDPRLLGRSRLLRDASSSPSLPADFRAQIVESWQPLRLHIAQADPTNVTTNKNFCERQGPSSLACFPPP